MHVACKLQTVISVFTLKEKLVFLFSITPTPMGSIMKTWESSISIFLNSWRLGKYTRSSMVYVVVIIFSMLFIVTNLVYSTQLILFPILSDTCNWSILHLQCCFMFMPMRERFTTFLVIYYLNLHHLVSYMLLEKCHSMFRFFPLSFQFLSWGYYKHSNKF